VYLYNLNRCVLAPKISHGRSDCDLADFGVKRL